MAGGTENNTEHHKIRVKRAAQKWQEVQKITQSAIK